MVQHLHNLSTPSSAAQLSILYRWLSFVGEFPVVRVEETTAWGSSIVASGSDGVLNDFAPHSLYSSSASFVASMVGKYVAVRDTSNPENSCVAEVIAFVSATELTLDMSTMFVSSSTDVSWQMFDLATSPSDGDYFVVQSPSSTTGPQWQVKVTLDTSNGISFVLGFQGGWDNGTSSWSLPSSTAVWLPATVARTFCIVDPAGWVYLWSEETGGFSSDINAVWFGLLSSFHSPLDVGVPKDLVPTAIFGSTTSPGPTMNLSRDTTDTDAIVVGEMLNASSVAVPAYVAQKRLLSSGDDVLEFTSGVNPRSLLVDDYDAIVFQKSPDQMIRGRIPGMRILNDSIVNRTPINSNGSYVLGYGIGASWNGKAPQP